MAQEGILTLMGKPENGGNRRPETPPVKPDAHGVAGSDSEKTQRQRSPAQTPPTPIADQWRLEKIFPNAEAILRRQPKISEVLKDCIFVFDTSALLTPYESKSSTITEIHRVLKPLSATNRLFVPQRALREFANNRGAKVAQFAARLKELQCEEIKFSEIPFLGDSETEKRLRKLQCKLREEISEYKKELDRVVDDIRDIGYNDPIIDAYRELFGTKQIIKSDLSREKLEEDFRRRVEFDIPPGYMDKHIGDLVIWHSMLDHGARINRDTVFISNDIKEDWAHQIGKGEEGKVVASRFELVYEYAERTNGRNFVQLQLAELLKYLKADDKVIQTVEDGQRAAHLRGIKSEHLPEQSVRSLSEDQAFRLSEALVTAEAAYKAISRAEPDLAHFHNILHECEHLVRPIRHALSLDMDDFTSVRMRIREHLQGIAPVRPEDLSRRIREWRNQTARICSLLQAKLAMNYHRLLSTQDGAP